MEKKFNIEGDCIPKMHYMADISGKIDAIFPMIEEGKYFTINRPHQYGKTTILSFLFELLSGKEDYLPISISFEGLGEKTFQEEENFIEDFLLRLKHALLVEKKMDLVKRIADFGGRKNLHRLSHLGGFLTEFLASIEQKVVLMIDEVDRSSSNSLFLQFLGLLRQKYLLQKKKKDHTFHSVILVGVHDVKNLKNKILSDRVTDNKPSALYNSPWNIAAKFKIDLSLTEEECPVRITETISLPDFSAIFKMA